MKQITKHRPPHINQVGKTYFISAKCYLGVPHLQSPDAKKILMQTIDSTAKAYRFILYAWVILNNHYHLLFTHLAEIADKSASPAKRWTSNFSCDDDRRTSNFSCDCSEWTSTFMCDQKIADKSAAPTSFSIGKVMGTIHGKSSSLIQKMQHKKWQQKSVAGQWWDLKYWSDKRTAAIANFNKKHQLADRNRKCQFQKLLQTGTPQQIVEFIQNEHRIWYQYTDRIIRNEQDFYRHLNYIHQNPVKHKSVESPADYEFSSYKLWLKTKGKEWMRDVLAKYPIADFEARWLE